MGIDKKLLDQISLKQKELDALTAQTRSQALNECLELINMFEIQPRELFRGLKLADSKPPKAPAFDYQALGFKVGDELVNPANAAQAYKFAKGPKPNWLKAQLEKGTTRDKLLKPKKPA